MGQTDSRTVKSYYDEHVVGKLRAFLDVNARVEAAWQTLVQFAPPGPTRICEVGCGIGDISWRMSRRFRNASVTGLDISPRSIEIASRLFGSDRVSFAQVDDLRGHIPTSTDLVVLMDVYEHIGPERRPAVWEAVAAGLGETGRVFLAFPSPRHQAFLRETGAEIQPVDEDLGLEDMRDMARGTGTELVLYKELDIWNSGDYIHVGLSRRPDWGESGMLGIPSFRGSVREALRTATHTGRLGRWRRRNLLEKRLGGEDARRILGD